MLDFTEDLQFVADRVSTSLNIFNKTKVTSNQLIIAYTDRDFIAVTMVEQPENPQYATLKLRTKDMAASWKNVPIGFSQINESRGLFADMKRAAHPSLKKNGLWYIDKQIKETIGEYTEVAEVASYRGYKYHVKMNNQYECYILLTKNEAEYRKPHDAACLFALQDPSGKVLCVYVTADECILTLVNMALMTDLRAAKFVETVHAIGGRAKPTHSYRLPDDSMDEVKAAFPNQYAIQLQIKNTGITMEVFSKSQDKMYEVETKTFEDMDQATEFIKELVTRAPFVPNEDDYE